MSIHDIDVENEEELVAYQVDLIDRLQRGLHEVIKDETGYDSEGFFGHHGFCRPCDYDQISIARALFVVMDDLGLRELVEDCLKEPPTKTAKVP